MELYIKSVTSKVSEITDSRENTFIKNSGNS